MENKLISMIAFIEYQEKASFFGQIESSEILQRIYNYTKFLKQPLTLGMFVPCDKNGSILTKDKLSYLVCEDDCYCRNCNNEALEVLKYQEAKEKVLFKGFEVEKDICFNGLKRTTVHYGIFIPTMGNLTIEDLIVTKKQPLKLTESALKQITIKN